MDRAPRSATMRGARRGTTVLSNRSRAPHLLTASSHRSPLATFRRRNPAPQATPSIPASIPP
ncbi:Hypothetical protein A7982_10725 [Minicystis rosea]|nr:Hypothetical protein A7982_10725 [Minicystis rosea]